MKQRKDFEKKPAPPKKKESGKSVQELTQLITHLVGKEPKKAARIVENWVNESDKKSVKKAA